MLQHLLREETIQLGLRSTEPKAALKEMLRFLPAWSLSHSLHDSILSRFLLNEKSGTTVVGGGVALPRCIYSGASFPLVSLGMSKEGVSFPSPDGRLTHLIFMTILPDNPDAHQTMQAILSDADVLLHDRFLVERLKISDNVGEAYEILLRELNCSQLKLAASDKVF